MIIPNTKLKKKHKTHTNTEYNTTATRLYSPQGRYFARVARLKEAKNIALVARRIPWPPQGHAHWSRGGSDRPDNLRCNSRKRGVSKLTANLLLRRHKRITRSGYSQSKNAKSYPLQHDARKDATYDKFPRPKRPNPKRQKSLEDTPAGGFIPSDSFADVT